MSIKRSARKIVKSFTKQKKMNPKALKECKKTLSSESFDKNFAFVNTPVLRELSRQKLAFVETKGGWRIIRHKSRTKRKKGGRSRSLRKRRRSKVSVKRRN